MNTEFITFIWLTTFDNYPQLREYVDWNFNEDGDESTSRFADDIRIASFDSGFLENAFVGTSTAIAETIGKLSFVEHFEEQLQADLRRLEYPDKNCIISLTAKRDSFGGVNEELFQFSPAANDKGRLQFVGQYRYTEA